MRRVALALVATAVGLVVLLSYKTPTTPGLAAPAGALAGPGGSARSGAGSVDGGAARSVRGSTRTTRKGTKHARGGQRPTGAARSPSTARTPAAARDRVVTGPVVDQPYGPVQVQVRVASGRIVDVATVQLPSGSTRSDEINQRAAPQLRQEVLAAQSARIDTVSGATYTSGAYRRSLQAALDAARG